jgi:hypothetical protein
MRPNSLTYKLPRTPPVKAPESRETWQSRAPLPHTRRRSCTSAQPQPVPWCSRRMRDSEPSRSSLCLGAVASALRQRPAFGSPLGSAFTCALELDQGPLSSNEASLPNRLTPRSRRGTSAGTYVHYTYGTVVRRPAPLRRLLSGRFYSVCVHQLLL